MTPINAPRETALDDLIRRNPGIDNDLIATVRKATEVLRRLGALTTEPTEAYQPFNRQLQVQPSSRATASLTPPTGATLRLVD